MWFAHSTDDPSGSDWEPLKDHLAAVARAAAANAEKFGAGPLGEALGLAHDLGRMRQ